MTLRSAILALLLCAAHAQARTLYVSLTGSHDTNTPAFSTWATAATNIQAAVDAASDGDTVLVAPGTYNAEVTINKNNLTVQGGRGTLWDADRTIIDRQGAASSVGVTFNDATNSTLRGFTVTRASPGEGVGAVYFLNTSKSNSVESSIVRGNSSVINATGGIRNLGSSNRARNCIVVGNSTTMGGISSAAYLGSDGILTVLNCISEANVGYQLYMQSGGILYVRNSIFGNTYKSTSSGGNVTNNTTNSVCRLLDIAPASDGVGTNLVWAGVSAYIPRLGSLARKNGVAYAGIKTASDGAGGPALVTIRPFIGRDVSTNRNHGGAVGGVTSASDSPFAGESSAAFPGGRVAGIFPKASPALNTQSNFTISAWIKSNPTNTGAEYIYSVGETANGKIRNLLINGSGSTNQVIQFGGWTINFFGTTRINTGAWRHVAVSVTSNNVVTLYVDGVAEGSKSMALVPFTYGGAAIGNLRTNYGVDICFAGQMSDVRVWNKVISDFSDRTTRLTGTEEGLVGYWPLTGTTSPIDTGPFNLDNPIIHPSYLEAF